VFTYTGTAVTTRQIVATKASIALGVVVSAQSVKLVSVDGAAWRFQVTL
jgi:hypothetical protein